MGGIVYHTYSALETEALGKRVGAALEKNATVCFFGDLGAGKTTFVRGLVQGVCQTETHEVHSPTFVYLHIYHGAAKVYHFDLYRLRDADEFISMGFDDFLETDGVCCLEWSEKIAQLLPINSLKVTLAHAGGDSRQITLST